MIGEEFTQTISVLFSFFLQENFLDGTKKMTVESFNVSQLTVIGFYEWKLDFSSRWSLMKLVGKMNEANRLLLAMQGDG